MNILDKRRIIESDLVPKEGALIEVLSSSIKITHRYGCVLVEHFACGTPKNKSSSPKTAAERRYYIELCPEHRRLDKNNLITPKGDNT